MNFHDPKEVIETMCLLTHDANDIRIEVEHETIVISAVGLHNNNFRMSWEYVRHGNDYVKYVASEFQKVLDAVIKEENKLDEEIDKQAVEALKKGGELHDWDKVKKELNLMPDRGQEVEFTRMNGGAIETAKGHVIRIDQDGIIEVHAFNRDNEGKFKYYLRPDEIHKPY